MKIEVRNIANKYREVIVTNSETKICLEFLDAEECISLASELSAAADELIDGWD